MKGWPTRRRNEELRRDALRMEGEHRAVARIRSELLDWLVGNRPEDAGLVRGRRVVTEIDRITPEDKA